MQGRLPASRTPLPHPHPSPLLSPPETPLSSPLTVLLPLPDAERGCAPARRDPSWTRKARRHERRGESGAGRPFPGVLLASGASFAGVLRGRARRGAVARGWQRPRSGAAREASAFVAAASPTPRGAQSRPAPPPSPQLFNVECQGDGDVTLPAGWRPLGPTRVETEKGAARALSARPAEVAAAPRGSALPAGASERPRARSVPRSPPEPGPLASRTRLDASPPSALGRWADRVARRDAPGFPGTARPARAPPGSVPAPAEGAAVPFPAEGPENAVRGVPGLRLGRGSRLRSALRPTNFSRRPAPKP